jgi:beta-lactamase regulating signal transducer with metallopeptidase domain
MIAITMQTVFATLADSTVKGCAVGGAALIASALLRRSAASARHIIWLMGAGLLLMLPLMSRLLPRLNVTPPPIVRQSVHRAMQVPPAPVAMGTLPNPDPVMDRADYAGSSKEDLSLRSIPMPPVATLPATKPANVNPTGQGWNPASVIRGLVVLWLAGLCWQLGRVACGLIAIWQLRRRSEPVTDEAVLALMEEARVAVGVEREVLLLTDRADAHRAPVTWGARRPIILLSQEMLQWPAERLRTVFIHEMAHIQRNDWLIELFAQSVRAVYWFHPIAWLITHSLHAESERACDDRVLLSGVAPAQYAGILLETIMAINRSQSRATSMPGMARPPIERRLRAILSPREKRSGSVTSAVTVGTLFLATVLPVTALHLAGQNAKQTTPKKPAVQAASHPPSTAELKQQIAMLMRLVAQDRNENRALRAQMLALTQHTMRDQQAALALKQQAAMRDQQAAVALALAQRKALLSQVQMADLQRAEAQLQAAEMALDRDSTTYRDNTPRIKGDRQVLDAARKRLDQLKASMGGSEAGRQLDQRELERAQDRLQAVTDALNQDRVKFTDGNPRVIADMQRLNQAQQALVQAQQQRALDQQRMAADKQRAAAAAVDGLAMRAAKMRALTAQGDSDKAELRRLADMVAKMQDDQDRQMSLTSALMDAQRAADARALADNMARRNELASLTAQRQVLEVELRSAESRYRAGVVTADDVAQVRAKLDAVIAQLDSVHQAMKQADAMAEQNAVLRQADLQARIASLQAQLEAAQAQENRLDQLYKAGYAPETDVSAARAHVQAVMAELKSTMAHLDALHHHP